MTSAVLIAGTLCDARIFGDLPDRLRQPIFLDTSAFSDARAAARALLDDVPPRSVGIAFSLGSWTLLERLRLDPARFSKLLLISGNSHPDAPENASMRRDRVAYARDYGFAALYAQEWPAMLGPGRVGDASIRNLITDMADVVGHETHARQCEMNIARPDHRAIAATTQTPIHVLAGAQDGLCPRDRYEFAASGAASSLTIVEGAGHYVPLEAPEEVLRFVRTHFQEASK